MNYFGNIRVDDDRYIIIPIVINGVYHTDYEIAPYMVGDHTLCEWVEHMRSKSIWWDKEYEKNFINAFNFVCDGKR